MKFWVVAKDGLLGRELCHYFAENKIRYAGSSHFDADIMDIEALRKFCKAHTPTHIINCAAYVNVDEAEGLGKRLAFDLNVTGTKNLVTVSREFDARLLHIGTDYVFDGNKIDDYFETDQTNPINEYGRTKLLGEIEVLKYDKGLCLRTASIYGSGKPGIISGILDMLKSREEGRHISDQISSPTYTKDIAEALFAIKDEKGVFHFTNSGFVSRYELVLYIWQLAKELGIEMKCKKVTPVTQKESKRAAIRPVRSVLSHKKIEPYLKKPICTWEEALREYIQTLC